MSSAPLKKPPSADPAVDLDYSVDDFDFEIEHLPDSTFLFQRMEDALVLEGTVTGGRTLDVACGVGKLAARFQQAGGEAWGIEPSADMLALSRFVIDRDAVALTRGVAETLPFQDATFDRIVCMGALDHFVEPRSFMQEAARLLKPDGRVVIALANYDSLSCRIGRGIGRPLQRVASRLLLRPSEQRPYWQPPDDHIHKGNLAFVRSLGGSDLTLERCYGISLLWLFPGWGWLLAVMPAKLRHAAAGALDRRAHGNVGLADTIISVWRKREMA